MKNYVHPNDHQRHSQIKNQRTQYLKTTPRRVFKAVVSIIIAVPLLMGAFAWECFKKDCWPWEING